MRQGYVYILASGRNGTLYTGVPTTFRRLFEHRSKLTPGFTSRYGVETSSGSRCMTS